MDDNGRLGARGRGGACSEDGVGGTEAGAMMRASSGARGLARMTTAEGAAARGCRGRRGGAGSVGAQGAARGVRAGGAAATVASIFLGASSLAREALCRSEYGPGEDPAARGRRRGGGVGSGSAGRPGVSAIMVRAASGPRRSGSEEEEREGLRVLKGRRDL